MEFDYSKLKGKIKEKYDTQLNFSKVLGISERSLTLKMNCKRDWRQNEIAKCIRLLDISPENIGEYFFNKKVQ